MKNYDKSNFREITIYNELSQAAKDLLNKTTSEQEKAEAIMQVMRNQSSFTDLDIATALAIRRGYANLHAFIKNQWNEVVKECCEKWKEIILR